MSGLKAPIDKEFHQRVGYFFCELRIVAHKADKYKAAGSISFYIQKSLKSF